MALIEGQKFWRIFPKDGLPLLYPRSIEGSRDWLFDVDPVTPDLSLHPVMAAAQPWEAVLETGDLLFVPSKAPHTVINLSDTVAISANFVDDTNLSAAVEALEEEGLSDLESRALVALLKSSMATVTPSVDA